MYSITYIGGDVLNATWSSYLKAVLWILIILLVLVLCIPETPKDFLILISAIVVLIGVSITQWIKLYSESNDRAYSFLLQANINTELNKNITLITPFIRENPIIKKQVFIDLCKSSSPEDKDTLLATLWVADYFEQMAIAIKYEQVNEILLRDFYIGIFIRFYRAIKNLIPLVCNNPPEPNNPFGKETRPEAFNNLDWLYRRWSIEYIKMLKKMDNK